MPLPYPAITKIPNTEPAAVPDLWNATYTEIDANFANAEGRIGTIESTMVKTLNDLGVTATADKLNLLSTVTSDVQTQINGKFANPAGTVAQYVRGDGTFAAFPTTWDWGSITGKPTTFAASGMTLAASDVPTLNQNTTGSAAKLATARTLTLGATAKSFDGSANVAWTVAELGAAPASHAHAIGNVTGLQSALDGKSATSHNHTLDSLTNVVITNISIGGLLTWNGTAWVNGTPAEAGIATASHTHAVTDVTGLQGALNGKLDATGTAAAATKLATARSLAIGSVTRSFDGTGNLSWTLADIGAAAASHTHTIANVSGLQTALDDKAASTHSHTLESLVNVTVTNNSTGEILRWNGTAWVNSTIAEAGLATASHSHVIADVTGLQAALDGKMATGETAAAANKLTTARSVTIGSTARSFDGTANVAWSLADIGAAATSHTHSIANVTGLQGALDAKSATSHNHTLDALSNVTITSNTAGELLRWTGTAWVNSTIAEAGIAPASHSHGIDDVSGLQTALNGKAATSHSHSLDSLSNVTITSIAGGELLRWSGTAWVNSTIAEAGVAAASHTHTVANVTGLQTALDGKLASTGTAAAATKLATGRSLTVGSTAKTFDGTANVSWSLAEIGAAGKGANTFSGVQTATGFTVSSLRAMKNIIGPLEVDPNLIDLFQPVTFTYKTAPGREVAGLIREDVAEIFPLACTDEGIDYGQLVPLLIVELQAVRARIAELESRAA